MKLTKQEEIIIDTMRRREHNWCYARWVLLVGSICIIILYIWLCLWTYHVLKTSGEALSSVAMYGFILPKVVFALTIASLGFGMAIRDWSGNANRRLLLKLVDHLEQLETKDV